MATDWSTLIVDLPGDPTLLQMLKDYLGIDDDTQDADLAAALNRAGASIEGYLDRVIAKRAVDEYFPYHFGTVILHHPQVDPVEPVTVNLDGVAQTDYMIYLSHGRLGHLSRIGTRKDMPMDWRTYEQVTVTYTAGFDPIPADLAQGLVYLASDFYKSEGTGNLPGGSGGSGEIKSLTLYDVGQATYDVGETSGGSGGSVSGSGVISDTVANIVYPYKRLKA